MAITLKIIAEKAEVSPATVSLALKNDLRIAEKTRIRINRIAKSLGYIPSPLGRSLQSLKSGLIGYIIPDATASFYNELIQSISEAAAQQGFGLLLGTGESARALKPHLRLFREKQVDGIIVSWFDAAVLDELMEFESCGTPLTVCDFESVPGIPKVQADEKKAMDLICSHLTGLGHTRTAFCFIQNKNAETRFRLCSDYFSKKKLPSPVPCTNEKKLINLLKSDGRPTAVICYSDIIAVKVKQIALEKGLNIPENISITGYDNIDLACWPEFSFTTVSQPRRKLGEIAFSLLLSRINAKKAKTVLLKPELIIRKSTAPPK